MALRYDLTAPLARFAAQNWETLAQAVPPLRPARSGATRSRGRAATASSSSATPTPWARRAPRPTPRSSPWRAGAGGGRVPRGGSAVKINNRKLLNGLMEPPALRPIRRGSARRGSCCAPSTSSTGWARTACACCWAGARDDSGDFTKGAGLGAAADGDPGLHGGAGGGRRGDAGRRLRELVGGSARATGGLAELAAIAAALAAARRRAVLRSVGGARAGVLHRRGVRGGAASSRPRRKGQPMRFGSIGGGGRYDDLVARFTGERTPATGFSFGGDRLLAALEAGRARGGRGAGRWWCWCSIRSGWPTTWPWPASCAPPGSPRRSISGPPACARR